MIESVVIESSGEVLATRVRRARTGRERRTGLVGSPRLEPGEGLLLERAFQVHTFGMRYPIDVVFCDKDWLVRHVVHSMPPRRLTRFVLRGRYALELPDAAADRIRRGDRLVVDEVR